MPVRAGRRAKLGQCLALAYEIKHNGLSEVLAPHWKDPLNGIQWFPGHMFKAKKELADKLSDIDVVIEMVDARLPMSSSNPMLAALIQHKPSLKILNKQDLADAAQTRAWLEWFAGQRNTRAIALDSGDGSPSKILAACRGWPCTGWTASNRCAW